MVTISGKTSFMDAMLAAEHTKNKVKRKRRLSSSGDKPPKDGEKKKKVHKVDAGDAAKPAIKVTRI